MRRLSKTELVNSLNDLFGSNIMTASSVQSALQTVPDQTMPTGSFTSFDNSIPDVSGLLNTSQAIVDQLFANAAQLNTVLGGCSSDEEVCRQSLVTKFAYRAWRRPLTSDEALEVKTLAKSIGGSEGLKYGVMRILLSPYFHQHVETGDAFANGQRRVRLTQFEIGSRLSYRLTGSLPDSILLGEAAAGRLSSLAALDAQATRLLQLPNARKTWSGFFDTWLEGASMVNPSQVVANEIGISADNLRSETRAETQKFVEYVVFDKRGGFRDLYTDSTVFPFTDRLAKIFGVGRSDSPQSSAAGYAGILLRPGKLMSSDLYTNPIARGVSIRKTLLCAPLATPTQTIVNERAGILAGFSHNDFSSREIASRATSSPRCTSCHDQSNPIGFALEGFGPLGRPRLAETIFKDSANSGLTHALNTYVDNLQIGETAVSSENAADVSKSLAKSAMAKECFSQKIMESTLARAVSSAESCSINDLRLAVHSGNPILDVIKKSVVNDSIFWKSTDGVQP